MKFTGMSRPIDAVGRVVIPKEIREVFNLGTGDLLDIHTTEEGIFLKKQEVKCKNCDADFNLVEFAGIKFCKACLKKAGELV